MKIRVNKKQICVLWLGLIGLSLVCIYPPWKEVVSKSFSRNSISSNIKTTKPAGYFPVFNPPVSEKYELGYSIDFNRLGLGIGPIVVLIGVLFITFRSKENER